MIVHTQDSVIIYSKKIYYFFFIFMEHKIYDSFWPYNERWVQNDAVTSDLEDKIMS